MIFIIIDDKKMLRTFFVKNSMRFFKFVRHEKNNKSFVLINNDDNNNWTDFKFLINNIEIWFAINFEKSKRIKNMQNKKNVKNIGKIEKTFKKNL